MGEGKWILELTTADPSVKGVEVEQDQEFDLEGRSLVVLRRG